MTTEERLAKVEQELAHVKRRSRWLLGGVALALGVGLVAWAFGPDKTLAQAASGAVKEVRANAFYLVDGTGKERASLAVTTGGPGLILWDAAGKPRAFLGMPPSAAGSATGLWLYDAAGKQRAACGVTADGPGLTLLDATGKERAELSVAKDWPRLSLFDENDKTRAILGVAKDGPRLSLGDEAGKVIWSAP